MTRHPKHLPMIHMVINKARYQIITRPPTDIYRRIFVPHRSALGEVRIRPFVREVGKKQVLRCIMMTINPPAPNDPGLSTLETKAKYPKPECVCERVGVVEKTRPSSTISKVVDRSRPRHSHCIVHARSSSVVVYSWPKPIVSSTAIVSFPCSISRFL